MRSFTMVSGLSGAGGTPDFSKIQAQMQQRSAQAFSKADGDGSGGLNVDEFKSMVESSPMAKMGGTQGKDASEAFKKLDGDGDGSVTQTELNDGMQKMMKQMSTQMFAQSLASPQSQGGGQAQATDSRQQQLQSLQSLLAALQNGSAQSSDNKYSAVSLLA
jgi:Ca2+-binding EF-hand superfamily protein